MQVTKTDKGNCFMLIKIQMGDGVVEEYCVSCIVFKSGGRHPDSNEEASIGLSTRA